MKKQECPNSDGYDLAVYSDALVFGCVLGGLALFPILLIVLFHHSLSGLWFGVLYFGFAVFSWLIMRKLTEATVSIKLNDIGLEQTKHSGARRVPEHLLIEWKDMKKFCVNTGRANTNIVIFRNNGKNYRVAAPWPQFFEKKKNGFYNFVLFQRDFIELAEKNGVRRGFWSKG